jgi:nucleoside-diphosphate-sugar epimerase
MIVITTPTGQIGSQVLENLLHTDEALRVIVRDAAHVSPDARERVEIVEGSHGDATVVDDDDPGDAVVSACVGDQGAAVGVADEDDWAGDPPDGANDTVDVTLGGRARARWIEPVLVT